MTETKRSYGQYCGLARALDVVGNRWSLLIVRELLLRPARYGELRAGLPGIATNLLAARLRELEQGGVVQRSLDSDSNSVVYSLTPRGRELRAVLAALVQWGGPLMISGPQDDVFQPQWLAVARDLILHDQQAEKPVTVGLAVDDAIVTVRSDADGTQIELDADERPDTVFSAEPQVVLGLASGLLPIDQALAAGELDGDEKVLSLAFTFN